MAPVLRAVAPYTPWMRTRRLFAALALPLVLLVGCGEDDGGTAGDSVEDPTTSGSTGSPSPESPAPSTSAPAEPACGEVWTEGAKLPRDYRGCTEAGALVAPDRLGCSSGQTIIRFDNRFYAVPGGTIHYAEDLRKDRDYVHDVTVCRG